MRKFLFIAILAITFAKAAQAQQADMVGVYNWYNPANHNTITVSGDEFSDSELAAKGWTNKTFLFYAYSCRKPHTVAVNQWYNATTHTYISVCEDEFTDEQMAKWGYAQKRMQFYGSTQHGANTVCVYRERLDKKSSWVTGVGDGQINPAAATFRKTFQYYGLKGM